MTPPKSTFITEIMHILRITDPLKKNATHRSTFITNITDIKDLTEYYGPSYLPSAITPLYGMGTAVNKEGSLVAQHEID